MGGPGSGRRPTGRKQTVRGKKTNANAKIHRVVSNIDWHSGNTKNFQIKFSMQRNKQLPIPSREPFHIRKIRSMSGF